MNVNNPSPLYICCPSCGFNNSIGTEICSGCGINMHAYKKNEEFLNETKEILRDEYVAFQENLTDNSVTGPNFEDKPLFLIRLRQAIFVSIISGIIVIIGIVIIGVFIRSMQIKSKESLQLARNCIQSGDYSCAKSHLLMAKRLMVNKNSLSPLYLHLSIILAKDAFEHDQFDIALEQANLCLEFDQGNIECKNIKCDASYLVAERYAHIAEWKQSINLLDDVIIICPNIEKARSLQEDIYERWYLDALNRNNSLEARKVKTQWLARYPENLE